MKSVLKEVEQRTIEQPDKTLFVFLDIKGNIKESYTYLSFESRTKTIASHIHANYALRKDDRILLAYPPGIEMICAFFACVRLGLIPVPVYPPSAHGLEASVQKMNFIAQDCSAKAVLTSSDYYWSYKINLTQNTNHLLTNLVWIASDEANHSEIKQFPEVHNDILFLQYTSGSTNDPKGVIVTHENILQNCNNVVDHLPVGVSWLPQYHDMGLIGYYIFFAVKGGTTYGFSPSDFIQRPALWLETISRYKATASSAPNFAYEYCLLPGKIPATLLETLDLSSLRFLMTAAEPIKPNTYDAFLERFKPYGLKPDSFFGAYGLAEYTLAVSNYGRKSYFFDTALLQQNCVKVIGTGDERLSATLLMSCGKALPDTAIKIIDTASGNKELPQGSVGEIWLNGLSKCRGYWNRSGLTKEIFEAEVKGVTENNTWLRTGDYGFMYEDELYVCGRLKDLIIIRGLNYYPQDIESLLENDSMIKTGCTAAFTIEKEDKESVVIIAGLKNLAHIPDAHAIHHKINKLLGISISEIVFVPSRTISRTSSGKIKRYDNKKQFLSKELQIIAHVKFDQELSGSNNPDEIDTEGDDSNAVITNYQMLLRLHKLSGNENATLGDSGLDSIKLAEFGQDLKTYLTYKGFDDLSQEVELKLLQKIAVSDLVEILKTFESASVFARFKFKKAFMDLRAQYEKAESKLMLKDTVFRKIEKMAAGLRDQHDTEGHILLTGGTGFFGPFLIKSLLEQTHHDIYVIVRADAPGEGLNRLRKTFKTINHSQQLSDAFEKRVKPIHGDLSKIRLGISTTDWNFLCKHIHTIYHNGASVNYLMDYYAMRKTNVDGTKDVIELALSHRLKTLNYISTTFIFGWSVKDTLFENDSNQEMSLLDFGYSQSKWVADQLVLGAIKKGLKARVFRPALISPSANGEGYNFDISIRLLSFMLKYGIGTNAGNQVSFTPGDIAANNIVAISQMDASIGHTFHVTRDEYSGMEDVTNILSALSGKEFTNFNLKDFVPEVVSRCTKNDILFPLLNFLVKSVDNISTMEFKRYDNGNYRKFRDMSPFAKADLPLEDVVRGIYKFINNNQLIS